MILYVSDFEDFLNYQQFQQIWPDLIEVFESITQIRPPAPDIEIPYYWKSYHNFTDSEIYGENGELIGTQNCYFILLCNHNGTPINTPTILLREWRDIRQYLHLPLQ